MRKNYPGGGRRAFWGQMECGLVLSSVSPWETVQKEKGVTRGGYVCKWCRGLWKGKMGSSRFLQITSGRTVLQLVLDEAPERLYNRWVKDRIEFYKRLEPTAPLRDVPLKVMVREDLNHPDWDGLPLLPEASPPETYGSEPGV